MTHPNYASNVYKNLGQIYLEHEKAKRSAYEERVLQAEKGSFVPLIFTTSGGMGPSSKILLKRLVEKLSFLKKERTSIVMNHLRTRIRFAILKSTLIALRGNRGKIYSDYISLEDVSLDILPNTRNYEMP